MGGRLWTGFAAVLAATSVFCGFAFAADGGKVTRADVDKAIAILEKEAAAEIAANAVAGIAVAVVFDDQLVFAKGFGVRDATTGEPVDADTVFQIASLSKPVGSTVVAALIGDGKITWDSKISDLDPGFALSSPYVTSELTIRDLYSHRSGLPDHSGDLLEDLGFSRDETLHRLRYLKPSSSFRAGYAYSNFGITEGGVAAVKAYGLDWEAASEEKLYKPLGMTSTSSRYADFAARPDRALGHVLVDGKWVPKFKRDPDTEAPAGGVSTSVTDLAKWVRLQLAGGKFDGKQIVDAAALAETHLPHMMTHPTSVSGIPGFYGLGWNVGYDKGGRHKISHSGAFNYGTGTNVNLSLDDGLGIIVLTNSSPTGVAEGLAANFIDNAIYGKPETDWLSLYKKALAEMMAAGTAGEAAYAKPPTQVMPPAPAADYVGTYWNDYFGDIEIIEKDGGLAIVQGPLPMTFPMTHFNADVFTYESEGESNVGRTGVMFTRGPDGKATTVFVENLEAEGKGTFARKK